MEVTFSSEKFVDYQRTARHYIPEDRSLRSSEWWISVLNANAKKIAVYWVVAPCSLVRTFIRNLLPPYEWDGRRKSGKGDLNGAVREPMRRQLTHCRRHGPCIKHRFKQFLRCCARICFLAMVLILLRRYTAVAYQLLFPLTPFFRLWGVMSQYRYLLWYDSYV
jgi:hypothetical protein